MQRGTWRFRIVDNRLACMFRDSHNGWAVYDRGGQYMGFSKTLPTPDEFPDTIAMPRPQLQAA